MLKQHQKIFGIPFFEEYVKKQNQGSEEACIKLQNEKRKNKSKRKKKQSMLA